MADDAEILKLQLNDNPGLTLVTAPLDGTNFLSWSRSIKLGLRSRMKLKFISEDTKKPEENTKEWEQWDRTDSTVTSWILNSISRDIVESFMYTNSSRELWVELENRFGQSNGPLEFRLKKKLGVLSQGSLTVSAYFSRLKKLWDELSSITYTPKCTCGAAKESADINSHNQTIQFLMGLNELYNHERNQILMMDPVPGVSKAYAMILRVEKEKEEPPNTSQIMAMQVYKRPEFQKKKSFADKRNQVCKQCGKSGHLKEVCFEIYGYPDWYKTLVDQRKKSGTMNNKLTAAAQIEENVHSVVDEKSMSELIRTELQKYFGASEAQTSSSANLNDIEFSGKISENSVLNNLDSHMWILDSGATAHMCNNSDLFDKPKLKMSDACIHLADGTRHSIKGSGTDHKTKEVLGVASMLGKLYVLKKHSFEKRYIDAVIKTCQETALSVHDVSSQIWHNRLGHISFNVLKHTGLMKDCNDQPLLCEICPKAKQERQPFNASSSISQHCFDLLHIDIWGPYNEYSLSRCSYMLTIVDDHSRTTWTFLMKLKSHTVNILMDFYNMILTQFERKIKTVRSDNGHQSDPITCSLPHLETDLNLETTDDNEQNITVQEDYNSTESLTAEQENNPVENSNEILRRSTRVTTRPTKLQDYICSNISDHQNMTNISYPTSIHSCLLSAASLPQEPKSFNQAIKQKEWKDAMLVELKALEKNQTWEITELPKNKRTIGCKWIFKLKLKPDGTIERYKARLVAKGYNQLEGIDYFDSFSPVAKAVTVRIFIALAAKFNWHLHQLDINNAFLHGTIDEEIYMEAPEGSNIPKGYVCKLKRSLYGLKQASRQWNQEFTSKLESYGFIQCKHDYCLFTKLTSTGFYCLLVYVDDVLLAGPSEHTLSEIKLYLDRLFTIKDLGEARFFLGLEIARSKQGITITQAKYIKDIVDDAKLASAKATTTPFPAGFKLTAYEDELLTNPEQYRRLLGRLLYLGFSRPDICYATQQLSQFMQRPCKGHWDAALNIVRYLKGTMHTGLFFAADSNFDLVSFCDADWAACKDSRRSLTGYCIFLGDSLISWKTKKQTTVARSSAEAEYRSMGSTTCELIWIHNLLKEFQLESPTPIPFFCDNQAALYIVANPVFHERTKHLEIDCHLVRDKYKQGFLLPKHIPSKNQTS
ncbi:UNVERIFIED_CONTAM: Retrovirus-related Pol polyprotein from transposon RE1 [Sesamum indicum]